MPVIESVCIPHRNKLFCLDDNTLNATLILNFNVNYICSIFKNICKQE